MILNGLVLSGTFGANVRAQTQQEPKWGGTLVSVIPSDPQSLNPGTGAGSAVAMVDSNMFLALITQELGPGGQWIDKPRLARSWEMTEDGLSYTFHLRDDVKWQDGAPFTAADVKFTFENVLLPLHPSGKATWGVIESIETPDDHTVVFHLKDKYPAFMTSMSFIYAPIIAKHIYTYQNGTIFPPSAIKDKQFDLAYAVGTGPFMITEYVKGDHITLVRNPNYYRPGLPYLDRIFFKIIPQPEMRPLALQAGDVDWIPQYVTTADVETLNKTEGIFVTRKGMEYSGAQYTLMFNMQTNPILNNSLVRTAIAHAINKQEVSQLATGGTAPIATTVISPKMGDWWNPNVHEPEYDPTLAEQLLDQAGYTKGSDGVRFKLVFNYDVSYSTEGNKIAEVVAAQLKKVGINVELRPVDNPTFLDKWNKHDFDLSMWAATGASPDPSILRRIYHSSQINKGFLTNIMGYRNPEVDRLLEQADTTVDKNARRDIVFKIQEILAHDLPTISLVGREYFTAYRTTFPGLADFGNRWVWGFRDPSDQVWWTEATGTSPLGEETVTTSEALTTSVTPPGPTPFLSTDVGIALAAVAVVAIAAAIAISRRRKRP
jgi:peptide/nickel transport system substrate-binding protein